MTTSTTPAPAYGLVDLNRLDAACRAEPTNCLHELRAEDVEATQRGGFFGVVPCVKCDAPVLIAGSRGEKIGTYAGR